MHYIIRCVCVNCGHITNQYYIFFYVYAVMLKRIILTKRLFVRFDYMAVGN
jgi:hypothetical protein